MAANFYQIKKVINGVEYTAQFNGLSAALDAVDGTYLDGTNTTSTKKFTAYILEHVIVEPQRLTVDDFTDIETLNAVISFGREVMQGHFRYQADAGTGKGTGAK